MRCESSSTHEWRVRCNGTWGANPTARLCQTRRSPRSIALVVEHDPWIRLVMCDVLAQAGFRVASASNGFSAVRLARREPLALVVLDLVLPEQSGLSVLAELKATPATAHVPVIVISGHPRALRDTVTQADAVIAKPFGTDAQLAEANRSRRRAVEAAVHCDSCHTSSEADRLVGSRRG
jgi:DNA-binding response OmpR family regulator